MEKRLGRYELRRAVGRGAAGTVWEAWDATLTRRVAVKVVRPGDIGDIEIEELVMRFRQEAQIASQLSHAGVVQVHDYGEDQGQAYIVMEYVDGETLKAALDRGGRFPPDKAAKLMQELLVALEKCHRLGVVHRDIKPSNIMLPSDGGVKLADFGIARVENSDLTVVGTVMGTASYMSPEQFTAIEPIDFRSDIWACGVVFYELLTGTRPFGGKTSAMIGQAVENDPVTPPSRRIDGLPSVFDQLVLRALRKSPTERFASAQAFATAIEVAARSLTAPPGKPTPPRRKWPQMAGGIGLVILLAAGIATWLTRTGPATHSSGQALNTGPTSSSPLPERLAALPCSTVRAAPTGTPDTTAFTGIIGSGVPRSAFDAIIASLPATSVRNSVETFPWSETACRLAELVRANSGNSATFLTASSGQAPLVTDDEIRLRLSMPKFDGLVRLDDLNSDGQMDHLMEANFGQTPRFRASSVVGLGKDGDDLVGHVSPPYGTDILVALVTSEPLFDVQRPGEEAAGVFVDSLESALAALRRRGGQVAADALVLTTAPR